MTLTDVLHRLQGPLGESCGTVCSPEELKLALQKERARSNRSRAVFSFVLFDLDAAQDPENIPGVFARALSERVRAIDTVGWMTKNSLGVILPATSSAGAKSLADEMLRLRGLRDDTVSYTIYTYPFTMIDS